MQVNLKLYKSINERNNMKNKIFAFAVLGCMTGIFLTGCDKTAEQKVEGAKQEIKEAKADYTSEWKNFKTESEAQIKVNEDRIDTLKTKIEKAGTKAKAKYQKSSGGVKGKKSRPQREVRRL